MTPSSKELRLDNPPVRYVRLTVNFQLSAEIQNWHLAKFLSEVASKYSDRQEVAPRPTADHEEVEITVSDSLKWPIPRTVLSRSGKSLEVQADQLSVIWSFDGSTESKYPGFENLLSDIADKCSLLVSSLADFDFDLQLQEVECHYGNEINGVSREELLVGVLTNWQVEPQSGSTIGFQDYAGIRFRSGESADHPFTSTVMVDAPNGSAPLLGLEVSKKVGSQDIAGELRLVHDRVIENFLLYVSEEMLKKWGRVS